MLDGYYFSIRVLLRHPTMCIADLTRGLGEEPDYSGEPTDGKVAFWSRVSETRGERGFFSEVTDVISWLEGKSTFVREVLDSEGSIEVIVQLPGDRNIGDSWDAGVMSRAGALGLSLGVEVFPSIRGVTDEI
jgi:hypothetical protein